MAGALEESEKDRSKQECTDGYGDRRLLGEVGRKGHLKVTP